MSTRALQRVRAPRLVRARGRRVRGRGHRPGRGRRQPRRGLAVRPAREPRAGVEPPRRRDAAGAAAGRPRSGGARLSAVTTPAAPPRASGVLIVLPPRASDTRLGNVRILGLPLARRIALAGGSVGYPCVFAAKAAADPSVLDGTAVQPWPESVPSGLGPQRLVLVPANVLVQRRWLREVLEMPLEPETLYVDGSLAAVVETKRVEAVLPAARDAGAEEVVGRLRDMFAVTGLPADAESLRSLTSADDIRGSESWLLQSLIKRNEGFMSRHVERRVSL